MENGWNIIHNSNNNGTSDGRGQNRTVAWDIRQLGSSSSSTTSRYDWSSYHFQNSFNSSATATAAAAAVTTAYSHALPGTSAVHALMLSDPPGSYSYAGVVGSGYNPDPHLMCLKLGKRHYFEDAIPLGDRHVAAFTISKRGRPDDYAGDGVVGTSADVTVAVPPSVPKCQVDGCHVALLNSKDYHRRHKVCEKHSKAPKVVVLGREQRFCQQCSRFHAVSEFDESKRSCRRRLAGHNERRRKNSHPLQENKPMDGRFRQLSPLAGRALSLLSSSNKNESWISSPDLSSRCSAALLDLIAENRAAILGRQLILDRPWQWNHHTIEDSNRLQTNSEPSVSFNQHQVLYSSQMWDRLNEAHDATMTLNLMQAPSSSFGFLSVREKSKEAAEDCSDFWNSLGGTHVV